MDNADKSVPALRWGILGKLSQASSHTPSPVEIFPNIF